MLPDKPPTEPEVVEAIIDGDDSAWGATEGAASRAAARSSSLWGPLRRLRYLIVITLGLALAEWVFLRFGMLAAGVVAGLFVTLPVLIATARGITPRRRTWFLTGVVALAGALAIGMLAGLVWAFAVAGMAALVMILLTWRLKLRHLMVLVAIIAVVIDLAMTFGTSALVVAASLALPLLVAVIYSTSVRSLSIEQDAMVSVLEMSTRSGLPMVPAVAAFEPMCPPRYRGVVDNFLTELKAGSTLAQAVEAVPSTLPRESATLVVFGEREGVLGACLRQAVACRHSRRQLPGPSSAMVGYPIIVGLMIVVALLFFVQHLEPRLRAIVSDFGVPLPGPTQWLTELVGPLGLGWNNIKPEEFLVALFALGCMVGIGGLIGWALWTHGLLSPTPGLWLERRRESAAILRGLSVALDADRPLSRAVLQLVRSDITRWSRRRWASVFDELKRGEALADSLRRKRLIGRADSAILESAQRVGNLPWALRTVADSIERRATYRIKTIGHFARLLVTLMLGGFVAIIAFAYFYPLVALIMHCVELL